MTVVDAVCQVTDWVRETVCSKIKLKVPPAHDRDMEDERYSYKLVHPAAFPFFLPTKDRLPEGVDSPIPSVCVQLVEGQDDLNGGSTVNLCLLISCWDPGIHGRDIYFPIPPDHQSFQQWNGAEARKFYRRQSEGWRDAYNLLDIARREILNAAAIGNLQVDRSVQIKYGPLTEQDNAADYYPFWFCWLTFAVKGITPSCAAAHEEFL